MQKSRAEAAYSRINCGRKIDFTSSGTSSINSPGGTPSTLTSLSRVIVVVGYVDGAINAILHLAENGTVRLQEGYYNGKKSALRDETLLVTVKTYPTPSAKYIETTCVSGITDDGHWIRLHPVKFRSLEDTYKFPRYSRIRVRVNKSTRDIRPESYHLDIDSIEQLGVIPTTNNWEQRRAVIEPLLSRSVEDLQDQNAAHGTSLGVIRPKEITRFLLQETAPSWSPEQLAKLGQQELFALRQIPRLEKIPFRFAYEFKCDDPRCHGHTMQVFDWEVAQAYRNWRQGKTCTEWEQMLRKEFDYKVRHMYDSLLFLGTLVAHPKNWIIGGIFFAPTERPLPTLW